MIPFSEVHLRLFEDAKTIWNAGVYSAQPSQLIDSDVLKRVASGRTANGDGRFFIVGCGKASLSMASAFMAAIAIAPEVLGEAQIGGLVAVPYGYASSLPPSYHRSQRIAVVEAGHPIPDQNSVRAVDKTAAILKAADLTNDDCVIAMISGGGSATWGAPIGGLDLGDVQTIISAGLRENIDIRQLNAVRRLMSRMGAGGLLRLAAPARVISIILSDVPANDLSIVASGPTHANASWPAALDTLRQLAVPDRIRRAIENRADELTRLADDGSYRVEHIELGSNRTAMEGASDCANARGYSAIQTLTLSGTAATAGENVAKASLAGRVDCAFALIAGGETTVAVRGSGVGGRNMEVALAASGPLAQCGRPVVLLCAGSDGIDGPTEAAGGFATDLTANAIRGHGLRIEDILARNDAFTALEKIDSLWYTGRTHTNVMDLAVLVAAPV